MTILLVLLPVVVIVGCQQQPEPAPTLSPMPNPPTSTLPEKGDPKLDSQLNQLIQAEKLGDAASFAEQSNIKLVDGDVRVIVESLPEQVEATTKAASALGVVETSYGDLLQVLVPVASLTTLADAASVRFVRLPQYPVPGTEGGGNGESN
jgi:PBP1b-binding outer membrane lipoprotein LpoB